MINSLSTFAIIAMFIEAFISYSKTLYENHSIQWQIVVAILISSVFCYDTQLNLFSTLGLVERFPVIGIFATAVVLSRGSNYFFEFYNSLSAWRKDTSSVTLNVNENGSHKIEYKEEVKEDKEDGTPVTTATITQATTAPIVVEVEQEDVKATY